MVRMSSRYAAAIAICVLIGMPASARDRAEPPKSKYDPAEIVCEKITVIGSRLAVKRVCATRAEWAERRRLDRLELDIQQKTVCVVGVKSTGMCSGN